MNDKFSTLMAKFKDFQSDAFAETHRLIDACDKAEAHCMEVLSRCK